MKGSVMTYKQRCQYLIGAFFVMIVLAYFLSISKSIKAYRLNKKLEVEIEKAQSAPVQINMLTKELKKWEVLTISSVGEEELQVRLFDEISDAIEGREVQLESMKKLKTGSQDNFNIETFEVVFQGGFKEMLEVLFMLESGMYTGKVFSAKYALERNTRTRKQELFLHMYIQSILKK